MAGGLSLGGLAHLLHYSNGVVRRRKAHGRVLEFRAASCTGAAYHIEAYVVCGDVPGLPAGVYHYDAASERLVRLRSDDFRANVASSLAGAPASNAEAFVVLSSTFWRNAWRYGERAYRHAFWDAGTVAANLLGLASQAGLSPGLHAGFVDKEVNFVLGLDARREAAICVVALGVGGSHGPIVAADPISPVVEPVSQAEIEYPLIWRTHAAGDLAREEAAGWSTLASQTPEPEYGRPMRTIIERRRSTRRFAREPLRRQDFDGLLHAALAYMPADFPSLADAYLIVHNVDGLVPGAYRFNEELRLIQAGDFRSQASHLALDQTTAGDAAFNLYFVTGLDSLMASQGERGYRAAQLEAGVRGGRVYLAATALGLGATGLTFYDDEVAPFFALPDDTAVLFLAAVGRPSLPSP
jgi:SagB-type dehydrogenase family enzyme